MLSAVCVTESCLLFWQASCRPHAFVSVMCLQLWSPSSRLQPVVGHHQARRLATNCTHQLASSIRKALTDNSQQVTRGRKYLGPHWWPADGVLVLFYLKFVCLLLLLLQMFTPIKAVMPVNQGDCLTCCGWWQSTCLRDGSDYIITRKIRPKAGPSHLRPTVKVAQPRE